VENLAEKPVSLSFGEADKEWEKYNLFQYPLAYSGFGNPQQLKDYKAIVQDGRLVAVTGSEYKLLPNEEAVEISDDVAKLVGAVPFDKFKGAWFVKMNTHVVFNKDKTRIHALYAFDEPVDMGSGDMIQLGFSVHNGIDGGRAFGAGGFTFRHACANMALMGWKGRSMEFDMRKTLAWVYHRHTAGLEVERPQLQKTIMAVIEQTREVIGTYKRWQAEELNREIAENLVKALPKKYLPGYIETTEGKLKQLLGTPKLYDLYNDITYKITHQSKSDLERKEELYGKLHAALLVRA
jgi:hypothetical protein